MSNEMFATFSQFFVSVKPLWAALSVFELAIPWAISHLRGDYSLIVGQLHVQHESNVSDDLQNFCSNVQVWNASKSNHFEFCFVGHKEGLLPRDVQRNEGGKVFDSTWWMRTPQEGTLINLNWCRCQQLQPAVTKRVINLSIAMFSLIGSRFVCRLKANWLIDTLTTFGQSFHT